MTDVKRNIPDFMIIGAMKCATTTLHRQLESQAGTFMTEPKEPNFFSDDDIYAQGEDWYSNLYNGATIGDLKGESSTHYTKFPTYPDTIKRMKAYGISSPKLIYMIRHPIDRLVSHYAHEWTMRNISVDINTALDRHPELIEYSMYHKQISHYFDAFNKNDILVLFFDSLRVNPEKILQKSANFIGLNLDTTWNHENSQENSSSMRWRKFPFSDILIESEFMTKIRKAIVPQAIRTKIKGSLSLNEKPELTEHSVNRLTEIFNKDLEKLGDIYGIKLNCDNFKDVGKDSYLQLQA